MLFISTVKVICHKTGVFVCAGLWKKAWVLSVPAAGMPSLRKPRRLGQPTGGIHAATKLDQPLIVVIAIQATRHNFNVDSGTVVDARKEKSKFRDVQIWESYPSKSAKGRPPASDVLNLKGGARPQTYVTNKLDIASRRV